MMQVNDYNLFYYLQITTDKKTLFASIFQCGKLIEQLKSFNCSVSY